MGSGAYGCSNRCICGGGGALLGNGWPSRLSAKTVQQVIHLRLPFPPSWNHLYGQRGSQKYLKPAGKAYKQAVAEIVAEQRIETIEGSVAVFVRAFMPDKRRRDIMNLEKILSDSLTNAGVWLDDYQIDDFRIVRGPVEKGGRVEVVITTIIGERQYDQEGKCSEFCEN